MAKSPKTNLPLKALFIGNSFTARNDVHTTTVRSFTAAEMDKILGCIHCGLCDLVCPDLCMVWGDGEPGDE